MWYNDGVMKRLPASIQKEYVPLIKDVVSILKKRYTDNLLSAVLYGSVARGQANKGSDIDICLIFRTLPEITHQRTAYVTAFENELRTKKSFSKLFDDGYYVSVSPVEFTADELKVRTPVLFLDIIDGGVVLLDDGTFEQKIEQLKKRMADLGTYKVTLEDGTHTWALKKDSLPGEAIAL